MHRKLMVGMMIDASRLRKEIVVLDLPLIRLSIALAIGLLIGLERGWSARTEQEGERAAGLRTHAISGLLGGVTALVSQSTTPLLLGFAFLGFAGVTALFHWMESRDEHNFSATGAVAGLMAFMLGAYAVLGDPRIASAAATATVVLLALKSTLHGWLKKLEWIEIRAVLILVTMTFLFLPLLPDYTIDPWATINPAHVWELAIFVCAISFSGYIAIRVFGERNGVILAALSGGLVSSTAATLNFARLARANPTQMGMMAGSIALANAVMCIRIIVIAGAFNLSLIGALWPVLGAAALIQGGTGVVMIIAATRRLEHRFEWKNPFEVGSAIQFALFIALILVLSTLATRYMGSTGLMGLAALSGLADVDAITLALARMQEPEITPALAINGIFLAAISNTLVKCIIAFWVGGVTIGWRTGITGLAAISTGLCVLLFNRL